MRRLFGCCAPRARPSRSPPSPGSVSSGASSTRPAPAGSTSRLEVTGEPHDLPAGRGPHRLPDRAGGPDQRAAPLRRHDRDGAGRLPPRPPHGRCRGRRPRGRPADGDGHDSGTGWSACASGSRSTTAPLSSPTPTGGAACSPPDSRSRSSHDHGGDRRRPGHGPGGVPLAAQPGARARGGRGGRRRRGGRRGGHPARARHHADGHPDAGARRHRGHPAHGRVRRRDPGAGADHLRPRRVRLRGPARRGVGLPAQGRPAEELAAAIRAVARGDSLLAPGGDPPGDRRLRPPRRAGGATPDGRLDLLTPREVEVLGLLARGLSNLDIATGSSSPRGRPRPT